MKFNKTITWQCFNEDVCNLVVTVDVKNIDHSLCLMITNEAILNVDVLGSTMKLWIVNERVECYFGCH